jgi:xylan 1,4-beta-xylosidase
MSSPGVIQNPILPGFHPDPCIVRVGSDFYIATSTFEWHPGVAIHHSRDLVHWRPVGHALTRRSQLDLRGLPDSGGVWAPGLSHDGEQFYLVYSIVRERGWPMLAVANYLVTATTPAGPWSEPVYLNGSGWDPSLFHDSDGRKWLVNMLLDPRVGHEAMGGIVLQEYDATARELVGRRHHISHGSAVGAAEGPHLYRRGGWIYLLLAEGGTWQGHATTMFRATSITGPYEACPANPILTARDAPQSPLQRAGHASLVEAPDGSSWLAYLCGRPGRDGRSCLLGRETALARAEWTHDGWLQMQGGGRHPALEVRAPDLPLHPFATPPVRDDFNAPVLGPEWQCLRTEMDPTWVSLDRRPGWLSLRGRDPITSRIEPTVMARRMTSMHWRAETSVDFSPESPLESAGLVLVSDAQDNVALVVTADDDGRRVLVVVQVDHGVRREPLAPIRLPEGIIRLRSELTPDRVTFAFAVGLEDWRVLEVELDPGFLADDHDSKQTFTGAFVGMLVEDRDRARKWAAFDHFTYVPL